MPECGWQAEEKGWKEKNQGLLSTPLRYKDFSIFKGGGAEEGEGGGGRGRETAATKQKKEQEVPTVQTPLPNLVLEHVYRHLGQKNEPNPESESFCPGQAVG